MTRVKVSIVMAALMMFSVGCAEDQVAEDVETSGAAVAPEAAPAPITLAALEDWQILEGDGYAPYYRDETRSALALDSTEYPDEFGAAETQWQGPSGVYDVTIGMIPEYDGESTYRLYVNGTVVRETQAPSTEVPMGQAEHTWQGVELETGDMLRLSSNTHSNELIPEDGAWAWARGRWTALTFVPGS